MFRLKFIDEIVKMAAAVAAFIIVALTFCEYALKPLWHIIQGQ